MCVTEGMSELYIEGGRISRHKYVSNKNGRESKLILMKSCSE